MNSNIFNSNFTKIVTSNENNLMLFCESKCYLMPCSRGFIPMSNSIYQKFSAHTKLNSILLLSILIVLVIVQLKHIWILIINGAQ